MEVDQKEITVVKQQSSRALSTAQETSIESADDLTRATDILSTIKQTGKLVKAKKEEITKPMNEALKNVRAMFAPLESTLEEAESIIKGKMLTYQRQVDAKAKEEEDKINKRMEEGRLRPETAARKMGEIETVAPTVQGDRGGSVQFRTVRKAIIEDESLLPREYLIPNVTKINDDALRGNVQIPGVKVVEEKQIAAR